MNNPYYLLEKGQAPDSESTTQDVHFGAGQYAPHLSMPMRLRIAANDAVQAIPVYKERLITTLIVTGAATALTFLLVARLLRR